MPANARRIPSQASQSCNAICSRGGHTPSLNTRRMSSRSVWRRMSFTETLGGIFFMRTSLERAVEGGLGHVQRRANVRYPHSLIAQHCSGLADLALRQPARSTAAAAPRARCSQARVGALSDQIPLELGQGPENVEDELPA